MFGAHGRLSRGAGVSAQFDAGASQAGDVGVGVVRHVDSQGRQGGPDPEALTARPEANCDILVSARDRLAPDTPELSVPASRARP
jgi:hypothetical protein